MRLWLKNPLAVLAEGAEGGVVVEGARIAELVARGAAPAAPVDETFDASRHVLLPGLVNAHHHFYQTLVRAHPAGLTLDLAALAGRALSDLGAASTSATSGSRPASRWSELLLSGCTTAADHHNLFPPGLENAIDIEVEEARALGVRADGRRAAR